MMNSGNMNKEELLKQIDNTERDLKKLKKELYEIENKELFDQMESNVGKFFREKNNGMGESKVIKIEGIDKAAKTYKTISVYYSSMLIGWYSLAVSYGYIYYEMLNPKDWEEIDKEAFYRIAGHNIEFATGFLKEK